MSKINKNYLKIAILLHNSEFFLNISINNQIKSCKRAVLQARSPSPFKKRPKTFFLINLFKPVPHATILIKPRHFDSGPDHRNRVNCHSRSHSGQSRIYKVKLFPCIFLFIVYLLYYLLFLFAVQILFFQNFTQIPSITLRLVQNVPLRRLI